jgi:hypothetical protein
MMTSERMLDIQTRWVRSLNSHHGSLSGLRTSIDVIARKHANIAESEHFPMEVFSVIDGSGLIGSHRFVLRGGCKARALRRLERSVEPIVRVTHVVSPVLCDARKL